MSILTKILGDPNAKEIARHKLRVGAINELRDEFVALHDDALRAKTDEFKKELESGKTLDDLLIPAFAAVREAMRRALDKSHFDVQLIGGMVMHEGKIAEMRTGEGKTFVATLPTYLNSLTGKGVHVITVNDYLARRDAGWLGAIYYKLGVSVGVIVQDSSFMYDPGFTDPEATDDRLLNLKPVSRREAYAADITYGTNNEFGFDYLRDNMVSELESTVQRELNYAVVDEVDSILIDEARTPLIISGQAAESTEKYSEFAQIVRRLTPTDHYVVDEKLRTSTLTDLGIKKIEEVLGVDNIYIEGGARDVHHLEQALRAHALFKLDKDYVVKDGEVIIVDEFTGRLMQGRRYSDGLHQAIEAKEGVSVKRESVTMATVSFQNYFRLYNKLSGMTGTAATEAEEFAKIYELEVVQVPTNREMIRKDSDDKIYKSEAGKFDAVVAEVKERHELGQPVLIGTASIEKNEIFSELLNRAGVAHEVLNAKNHEREAMIISQAGKLGAVTVATNMAGRGVDIILGGEPFTTESHQVVKDLGGLHVIGSERHESRRIDNQLRGRAARQGDPGSSQFFVSVEDDLMRVFGGDRVKQMMEVLKIPEDQPIQNPIISKSLESAQRRVEGSNFDTRKHLVEYDDVMNKHRKYIYGKRRAILEKADLKIEILEKIDKEVSAVIDAHSVEGLHNEGREQILKTISGIVELPASMLEESKVLEGEELKDFYFDTISRLYEEKEKGLDGEMMRLLERLLSLRAIDQLWVEHIDSMEHMRQGIGLRGYAQKDPLVEYKHESHKMFDTLLLAIDSEIIFNIMKATITNEHEGHNHAPIPLAVEAKKGNAVSALGEVLEVPKPKEFRASGPEVGRNDPCYCGSGLKYKKCHGK